MPKKRKKGSFSMSSRYFFVICSECRMTKEANLPASEKVEDWLSGTGK